MHAWKETSARLQMQEVCIFGLFDTPNRPMLAELCSTHEGVTRKRMVHKRPSHLSCLLAITAERSGCSSNCAH